MEGKHGHLNKCQEYVRTQMLKGRKQNELHHQEQEQTQERTILTNQFPVVENNCLYQPFMQMEEYSRVFAPDQDHNNQSAERTEIPDCVDEQDESLMIICNEPNEDGLQFQKLLLKSLYDYFSNARKRRPNRTRVGVETGELSEFVNNRTLGRFYCFAMEWQLPTEGLST
jgi:hypothetical protein